MDFEALAGLLFPDVTVKPEYYEALYPARVLPEGAKVTRFAPSPTGFVHFGGLFPVLVNERLAHMSGGVFYLRIEDTDSRREVKGAEQDIINAFAAYGINFDESITVGGAYGPYRQSERRDIYRAYAKSLVEKGLAYPCFCSAESLINMRETQRANKENIGYYGRYRVCRDLSLEEVKTNLQKGLPFVLRLRSGGSSDKKIPFTDLIKGKIELTENDIDHILLKSDGMPDYHFAHAIDDHLMHTTVVVRGEEWLPSLPFHIQIFKALGFSLPKYMHISQLMRLTETGAKKKLSKRDKGAGLTSYLAEGYPPEVVLEYVMSLLNSNFEDWRTANPEKPMNEFPFAVSKMSASGCLFDPIKLADVSKNLLSRRSAQEIYDSLCEWTRLYDKEFYTLLTKDPEYTQAALSIGRGGKKPRKDFALYSEVKAYMGFFYKELFAVTESLPDGFDKEDIKNAIKLFVGSYSETDDNSQWFENIKNITRQISFCDDMKLYKAQPDDYKGSVADVSSFLRLAVTGRLSSPDLYSVMQILGKAEVIRRLNCFTESL